MVIFAERWYLFQNVSTLYLFWKVCMLNQNFSNIIDLIEFIQLKPHRAQLVHWLHENLQTQNTHPRVSFYELSEDGFIAIKHDSSSKMPSNNNFKIGIDEDFPAANVLRTQKMRLIGEKEFIKEFSTLSKFKNISEIQKFRSVFAFPVSLNKGYSLLFENDVTLLESTNPFMTLLETIIKLYEVTNYRDNSKDQVEDLYGQELTKRQHAILDLMKLGRTNLQIASHLKFSVSLIRQETIAIYGKLGVKGRKEILKEGK